MELAPAGVAGRVRSLRRAAGVLERRSGTALVGLVAATALGLGIAESWHDLVQTSIDGVIVGNYYALGAVGLTLIFGVLRLVNFAHGEFLTFGAYMLLIGNALHLPLVLSAICAVAVTGLLGVGLELGLWRPVRRKRVGELQLLLVALGLAFVVRYTIAFVAGYADRRTGANVVAGIQFGGYLVGRTALIVTLIGVAAIVAVAAALRYTSLGRQVRALADNIELAETTGIDTDRVVVITWAVSAGLAGLAGVVYALPSGIANPNIGFSLILGIFAAVIVGGIGNAYGALAGGVLIGLAQEWSTLVIAPQLKVAVGFAILVLVLLLRPQGLFGRARRVEQ